MKNLTLLFLVFWTQNTLAAQTDTVTLKRAAALKFLADENYTISATYIEHIDQLMFIKILKTKYLDRFVFIEINMNKPNDSGDTPMLYTGKVLMVYDKYYTKLYNLSYRENKNGDSRQRRIFLNALLYTIPYPSRKDKSYFVDFVYIEGVDMEKLYNAMRKHKRNADFYPTYHEISLLTW